MQLSWNRATWNPLVCRILAGLAGGAVLLVFVFYQPWIPLEITRPETGVLVALEVPTLENSSPETASANSGENEPIAVSIAKQPEHSKPVASAGHFVQTVESPPPFEVQSKTPIPTYAEHIAPLLKQHCVVCHQEANAQLRLTEARHVVAAASRIAKAVQSRRMPPWQPKPGFGHFRNQRRLADAEIGLIQSWVQAGSPLGDLAELPGDVDDSVTSPWRLGKPTVAYQLPKPFHVPASAAGLKWNFVIPTGVKRELFLTGVELRPGNKALVKHMTLSFDPAGTARKKDQETPRPGFPSPQPIDIPPAWILGEWSPGRSAQPSPTGAAYRIPAGADLVLTVEYAGSPVSASDPWSMGLHISRKAPKHLLGRIEVTAAAEPETKTTAGLARQFASYQVPTEVTLFSVRPQIAGKGIGIRAYVKTPSGQNIPLVHIENWEPGWNEKYVFAEPITLPKKSTILVETWIPQAERRFDGPPAAQCVFEVATPTREHLKPLIRHNTAANLQN